MRAKSKKHLCFTVDVEEWFHILESGNPSLEADNWCNLEARGGGYFLKLLEMLAEKGAKATFFFLGWMAERQPELVRAALSAGHEIASHGYWHKPVYAESRETFRADIRKCKMLLEDLTGKAVAGYRAPGFSMNRDSAWGYEVLAEEGFLYSSSVFPSKRSHGGGYRNFGKSPKIVHTPGGNILEFPVPSLPRPLAALNCFGGGYFRLFPLWWYKAASRLASTRTPQIFYIHPRDYDTGQPKLELDALRRFKTYVNIEATYDKTSRLIEKYECVLMRDVFYKSLISQKKT